MKALCQDSTFIRAIYTEALERGYAYSDLRDSVKI